MTGISGVEMSMKFLRGTGLACARWARRTEGKRTEGRGEEGDSGYRGA